MAEKKVSLGKVLVIGGNGFLGHHIVSKLLQEWDAQVMAADLRCSRNRFDGASYHEVNIIDAEALLSLFQTLKPDLVIHTASPTAQGDDAVARDLFKTVNVGGTTNVIAACQKAGVKALVYTSSESVVSDSKTDLRNADERWPVLRGDEQPDYYAETKVSFTNRVADGT